MRIFYNISIIFLLTFLCLTLFGQKKKLTKENLNIKSISQTWISDQGNGTYRNPVIDADYSDPDVIRVNDDYYMVSSSFDAVPGLPILHSKDLINWTIINHALLRQPPYEHFSKTQHGNGVWAPSIRYHNGEFYIYYPDPDFGIYLTKAKDPAGEWSVPILVEAGKGLIDPCPLWDENGKVYLAYAYAGSRSGIKSVIAVKELNNQGTKTTNTGKIVYDGHELDPTIEGPKLYKRNGFYYIFAPAGGVSTGWQLILRSKNINGPYERKVAMDQGNTSINGPHQGAWVVTQTGEDWFFHFQDKGVYGRVVHLQPMKWINDWPVIGEDKDGDGKGQPILSFKKPNVGKIWPISTPAESDEFNDPSPGRQWQWQANPKATWSFMNVEKGALRLYTDQIPDSAKNYYEVPNILLQKFPTEEFVVTTKLRFSPNPKLENERVGLMVMGLDYANISLISSKNGTDIIYGVAKGANKGKVEIEKKIGRLISKDVYFRVTVKKNGRCQFSYSEDGNQFTNAGELFQAEPGHWIGAKVGLFASRKDKTNDSGYADFDWFRLTSIK